jgi:TniQ
MDCLERRRSAQSRVSRWAASGPARTLTVWQRYCIATSRSFTRQLSRRANRSQSFVGRVLRPHTDFTAGPRRACPACLVEAPYHRLWWDWTFVSSCPFHNCMLAKTCSCGSTLTWKDGCPFRCRLCNDGDVRRLAFELADPKVLAFDRWAVDRLLLPNRTPKHFIDAVPLGYAAEIVKRIGALSLGGYQPRLTGLSKLGEPHIIRAQGFEDVVMGTMDAVLDRAYEGYITATQDSTPCLRRMYGWFYPWFQFIGGWHLSPELARLIFQNASQKIQVTRRAFGRLSRTGTAPLTLSEAARTAKVRHSTMRRLLAAEGLIREQKLRGVPVLVSSAIAERIAADVRQSLTLVSLGGVLAVSRTAITKLVRAGLVPTWLPRVVPSRGSYLFRRKDVLRWMVTIIGAAPTVLVRPRGTVDLADAPSRCSLAITVLVRAIVSRELSVVAVQGERRNFRSALVSIAAVLAYKKRIGAEAAKDPLRNYVRSTKH